VSKLITEKLGDWYVVDEEKRGVDSRDEAKHTERIDPLFVEKMISYAARPAMTERRVQNTGWFDGNKRSFRRPPANRDT